MTNPTNQATPATDEAMRLAGLMADLVVREEFVASVNTYTILRTNIEAMERETLEQPRLNGMGAEREERLMARVAAMERENEALRADIDHLRRKWLGHRDTGHLSLIEAADQVIGGYHAQIDAFEAERDAMRAELAQAKVDAGKPRFERLTCAQASSFEQDNIPCYLCGRKLVAAQGKSNG